MKYYRIKIAGHSWLSKDPYDNYEKWHHEVIEKMFELIFHEQAKIEEITKEDFEKEKN